MIKKVFLGLLVSLVAVVGIGVGIVKFNQKQNLDLLFADHLDGRLIAHKVNLPGKLEAVLGHGIRSIELDVMFHQQGNTGYFEIGHDKHEAQGVRFTSYLDILKDYPMKKIWMDVKNITDENASAMLKHLEELNEQYHIKPIVLLESPTTSTHFKDFSQAGFYTSYYLPAEALLKLQAQNNPDILKQEAKRIRDWVASQAIPAISFPAFLYPFVKTYVEPELPQTIDYHTWNIIKLEDRHALEKLKEKPIFQDSRIRTIIYSYHYIS